MLRLNSLNTIHTGKYHTKYGNNKIPAYGCYDLSSKKYLEDVHWEHYIEENNSFLFF